MERKLNMTTVKSKWTSACNEIFPGFKIDSENEHVIKMLQLYIARDERFETVIKDKNYSLNKGILLHGNYGTGKTILFRIMQRAVYFLQLEIQFKRFNMRELCQQYQSEGAKALMPENRHWFVDEFGIIEREQCNSFGNKIVVGDELIGVRYDRFQSGFMTHLTTNLTYQQINDFYNPRTISRLHEMCNFIPLDGTDRRLTAKPQAPVKVIHERPVDRKQVDRDWWAMIKREQAAYKNGGTLMVLGPLRQFTAFENAGLVLLSKEEKLAYIDRAKGTIQQQNEDRLKYTNRKEYKKVKSLKDALANNALNLEQENDLKTLAVNMAIQDFYDSKTIEEFTQLIDSVIEKIK